MDWKVYWCYRGARQLVEWQLFWWERRNQELFCKKKHAKGTTTWFVFILEWGCIVNNCGVLLYGKGLVLYFCTVMYRYLSIETWRSSILTLETCAWSHSSNNGKRIVVGTVQTVCIIQRPRQVWTGALRSPVDPWRSPCGPCVSLERIKFSIYNQTSKNKFICNFYSSKIFQGLIPNCNSGSKI